MGQRYFKPADRRELETKIFSLKKRIAIEEVKSVDDFSPGHYAWLMNRKECLENDLAGTRKLKRESNYIILEQ